MSEIDTTTNEIWKPVPKFEDSHEVSSLGSVRRISGGRGTKAGRILKASCTKGGHARISLYRGDGTRGVLVSTSWLVCAAFIGPCPDGRQVNHKDGNPRNNSASNLEYVTPRENCLHRCRVLGIGVGENNGQAKLKSEDVQEIRRRIAGGESQLLIARSFGVSRRMINYIKHRSHWIDRGRQYLTESPPLPR